MQDRRALRKLHEQDLPAAMEKLQESVNPFSIRKKSKLVLPEPTMSESELLELAHTVQKANDLLKFGEDDPNQSLTGMFRSTGGTKNLLPLPTTGLTSGSVLTGVAAMAMSARNTSRNGRLSSILTDQNDMSMTRDTGTDMTSGSGAGNPEKKRKKGKRSANRITSDLILNQLSPATNDIDIDEARMKNLTSLQIAGGTFSDDEPIEEDQVDKERKLKEKIRRNFEKLAIINQRGRIFRENLPRPLDLSLDPSVVKMLLQTCRNYVPDPSKNSSEDICSAIQSLIDEETAFLYVEDEKFVSAAEQMKIATTFELSREIDQLEKAFLAHSAEALKGTNIQFSLVSSLSEVDIFSHSRKHRKQLK